MKKRGKYETTECTEECSVVLPLDRMLELFTQHFFVLNHLKIHKAKLII